MPHKRAAWYRAADPFMSDHREQRTDPSTEAILALLGLGLRPTVRSGQEETPDGQQVT